LRPGGACGALEQANSHTTVVARLTFPEFAAIRSVWEEVWFSMEIYPVLAVIYRRTVGSWAGFWQTILLWVGSGLLPRDECAEQKH